MTKQQTQDWQALYESIKVMKLSQEKTDQQVDKVSKNVDKVSEHVDKVGENIDKMGKKIDKLGTLFGNYVNNEGEEHEEFFFRSFEKNKELGGIKFDSVRKHALCTGVEFDIVLVNSNAIAVVSVKKKVHENDIKDLAKRALPFFKKNFKEFKNYKLYGAIASKNFPIEFEKVAAENGMFAITQAGQKFQVLNKKGFKGKCF